MIMSSHYSHDKKGFKQQTVTEMAHEIYIASIYAAANMTPPKPKPKHNTMYGPLGSFKDMMKRNG